MGKISVFQNVSNNRIAHYYISVISNIKAKQRKEKKRFWNICIKTKLLKLKPFRISNLFKDFFFNLIQDCIFFFHFEK